MIIYTVARYTGENNERGVPICTPPFLATRDGMRVISFITDREDDKNASLGALLSVCDLHESKDEIAIVTGNYVVCKLEIF